MAFGALGECERCGGLLPMASRSCPHCEARIEARGQRVQRVLRTALQCTAGGAIAMTLMACYGAPGAYQPVEGPVEPPPNADTSCQDAAEASGECSENPPEVPDDAASEGEPLQTPAEGDAPPES